MLTHGQHGALGEILLMDLEATEILHLALMEIQHMDGLTGEVVDQVTYPAPLMVTQLTAFKGLIETYSYWMVLRLC